MLTFADFGAPIIQVPRKRVALLLSKRVFVRGFKQKRSDAPSVFWALGASDEEGSIAAR